MYKFKCKYQPPSVNDFSTMVVGPYERRGYRLHVKFTQTTNKLLKCVIFMLNM